MTTNRAPNWTLDEFDTLLKSPNMADDELQDLLPRRTLGAIGFVCSGIHAFHTGKDISMLSIMMRTRLEDDTTGVVCPVCGEHLD